MDVARTASEPIKTDAVIIGAGPVGLFQVFELGLLEIKAHVVDTLPYAGGQCVELYADKPIYDIPAVKVCTGRELAERLLQQIEPFGAQFHFNQVVTQLQRQPDGRFLVTTSAGARLLSRTVLIAGGAGSFQPRTLKIDGVERFADTQLFYRVPDAAAFAGQRLVIVGGGDSALDWALHFAQANVHADVHVDRHADAQAGAHAAASVILIHRRDAFSAAPASVAKMRALCEARRLQFITGQITGYDETAGHLTQVKVTGGDGVTRLVALDALLVFFGLSPKLGPIADWGLALERKQVLVDTEKFETSVPGIFAVGDVNTYPGKKKLILSGFHEATLAAFGAARHVFPDRAQPLQYTTTSPKLHRALGVESPRVD